MAAIRAVGDDPWAHLAVATAHMGHKRFEEALAVYESTLRLNPSFALAQAFYGCALSALGRAPEGGAAARRALRLSPRDPFSAVYSVIAGYAEYAGGDFEEAMRFARDAVRLRPDVAAGYRVLTAAAAMAGEPGIAEDALAGLRRSQPNISLAWMAPRCSSRTRPSAHTTWKASGAPDAPDWNSASGRSVGAALCRARRRRSAQRAPRLGQ